MLPKFFLCICIYVLIIDVLFCLFLVIVEPIFGDNLASLYLNQNVHPGKNNPFYYIHLVLTFSTFFPVLTVGLSKLVRERPEDVSAGHRLGPIFTNYFYFYNNNKLWHEISYFFLIARHVALRLAFGKQPKQTEGVEHWGRCLFLKCVHIISMDNLVGG